MALLALLAYMSYPIALFAGQLVIGRFRKIRPVKRVDLAAKQLLLMLSVTFTPLAIITMEHQKVRLVPIIIGTAIIIAGLTISLWAQWELGSNWVGGIGIHKGHQLITTGPYRYVRHPLYSGMLLAALGQSIFGWNLLFALAVSLQGAAFLVRCPDEESVLRRKFKRKYDAYASTTGMLFPRR